MAHWDILISTDQALRYNEWKLRWSLVDWRSMEPLVQVLEYWARKYTQYLISFEELLLYFQLWKNSDCVIIVTKKNPSVQNDYVLSAIEMLHSQLQHVLVVEKWGNSDHKTNADHVSRKNDSLVTRVNYLQGNYTNTTTEESLKILQSIGKDIIQERCLHDFKNIGSAKHFWDDWNDMEWLKIFTSKDANLVAEYVDQLKGYTLIMTIIHDYTETYYVVNAINDSDCLMTLLKLWQKLWLISNDINAQRISGENNWKNPMDKKQILNSMMRHMVKLIDWEEVDSESWLGHIWHIMANALFYSYHSQNNDSK